LIVVDASAAVRLFCWSDEKARWLRDRLEHEALVSVPALFDLEVLQALRRLEARDVLEQTTVRQGLANLVDLRATRHDHAPFRSRIWSLRHNLTAYDAAYVALAEILDAPLITVDTRLARSSGHKVTIEAPPL